MSRPFITNISFPKSLDEVLYFMKERGRFDVEEVAGSIYVEWTAPKGAQVGDTAFFMHSKTSIDTIRHLKRELERARDELASGDYDILLAALNRGEDLYRKCGGAIFAQGTVCGEVIVDNVAARDGLHWRSVYYAPIDSISLIEPPDSYRRVPRFYFDLPHGGDYEAHQ
ncbi:MAG: hypothetical protein E7001_04975 [Coriobacteriaceae bacterium]|nr:hypothetical protein [Coriobacteriaceae bacterium]